jgi:hypothetical protein
MPTEIPISIFKVHCLKIISQFSNNQEPITITKKGKPVAKIQIFKKLAKTTPIFDLFSDKAQIVADIIDPISEDWSCEK